MNGSTLSPMLLFIAAILFIAGFVKGVVGLGLPTVAIGLLATRIAPLQAVAIVIIPAIVTNIWQTFVGPHLLSIVRRIWPMMIGTCVGVWCGAGLMTGPFAAGGGIVLGLLLVIYAIVSLTKFRFSVPQAHEKWLGGIAGALTGVISAATGVQVIPSMPFLQAMGMEKDELVQALGIFFTTATLALSFNLTSSGILTTDAVVPSAVALVAAFIGMFVGQTIRSRMNGDNFKKWFLISMLLLGLYLAGSNTLGLL
jgi:uncharacterized membrane protein YfcA